MKTVIIETGRRLAAMLAADPWPTAPAGDDYLGTSPGSRAIHSGLRTWDLVLVVLHFGAFGAVCSISLLASALFKGRKWEGVAAFVAGLALMGYALATWSQPWGAVFATLPLCSYVLPGLKGLRGKAGKTLVDDFVLGTIVGWVIVVLATMSILVFF